MILLFSPSTQPLDERLTQARRKFAELEKVYPKACGYALDQIAKIYGHGAAAREMSDEERLAVHQKESLPIMMELKEWMERVAIYIMTDPIPSGLLKLKIRLDAWRKKRKYLRAADS